VSIQLMPPYLSEPAVIVFHLLHHWPAKKTGWAEVVNLNLFISHWCFVVRYDQQPLTLFATCFVHRDSNVWGMGV
jgi:hypothetical protein